GAILGRRLSNKVEMTGMPQLVSLFNATGGGCAMLLGILEARQINEALSGLGVQILLIIGLITGALAFTGSIVANLKLSGKLKDNRSRAVVYIARALLISIFVLPLLYYVGLLPVEFIAFIYIVAFLSLVYGFLFVLPIG